MTPRKDNLLRLARTYIDPSGVSLVNSRNRLWAYDPQYRPQYRGIYEKTPNTLCATRFVIVQIYGPPDRYHFGIYTDTDTLPWSVDYGPQHYPVVRVWDLDAGVDLPWSCHGHTVHVTPPLMVL